MLLEVFAVRDSKAQTFGNPLVFPTIPVVLRSLGGEVNKGGPDSLIAAHPEDFELFHLGQFDPSSALFTLFPAPRPICLCNTLKNGSSPA